MALFILNYLYAAFIITNKSVLDILSSVMLHIPLQILLMSHKHYAVMGLIPHNTHTVGESAYE